MQRSLKISLSQFLKNRTLLVIIFIIAITLLLSFNNLKDFFLCDDFVIINHSNSLEKLIESFVDGWKNYFNIYYWSKFNIQSDLYRPLVNLSFFLDYKLWNLNPFGYHLTNIIIYALTGFFLYRLTELIFHSKKISYITLFFWFIHPSHIEPLLSIANRTDSLVGLFEILVLYCFVLAVHADSKNKQSIYWRYLLLSIGTFLLALLSKETAILFPLSCLFYDLFINKADYKSAFRRFLPYTILMGAYMLSRLIIFKGIGNYGSPPSNILGMFKNLIAYIGVSIVGTTSNLIFIRDHLAILIIGLILGIYILYSFCKKKPSLNYSMISWLSMSFLVSLGPALAFISNRFLYLAVYFLILLIVSLLQSIHIEKKMLLTLGSVLLIILYSVNWALASLNFSEASRITYDFLKYLSSQKLLQNDYNLFTILPDNVSNMPVIFLNGQREMVNLFLKKDNVYPLLLISSYNQDVKGLKITKLDSNKLLVEDFDPNESIVFSQMSFDKLKEGDSIENEYARFQINTIKQYKIKSVTVFPKVNSGSQNYLIYYSNGRFDNFIFNNMVLSQ